LHLALLRLNITADIATGDASRKAGRYVLISILVPSISRAREYAKCTACSANGRTLATALSLYLSNTNAKSFPMACYDYLPNNDDDEPPSWYRLTELQDILPVAVQASSPAANEGGQGLVCPGSNRPWSDNYYVANLWVKSNYAMNYFVTNHLRPPQDYPGFYFYKVEGHPNPERTILFGEAQDMYYANDDWKCEGGDAPSWYSRYFPDHHGKKLNYVMFDMSVKTLEKPADYTDTEVCTAPGAEGQDFYTPWAGPHWCYYNRYGIAFTDETDGAPDQ